MRIYHKGRTYWVEDQDPRIEQIMELLKSQDTRSGELRLWESLYIKLKELLWEMTKAEETSQKELEKALQATPEQLRGLLSGIAKLAKRAETKNPVTSAGSRRNNRSYKLDPAMGKLVRENTKGWKRGK